MEVHAMRRLVDTPCGCLDVHDVGRPEAPVILLLPIVPFSSWIWRTAQTVFAARGWRTIAVDPMGYGRSDKRRGVWTVADFAQNLDDLLAAVEAPRAFVVAGHFAALPAIELAVAYPDRVAALWLDGPPVWSAQMRATVAASRASAEPETWSIQDDMGALVWQRLTSMLKKLAPDGFAPGPALNDALRRALIDFTEASFEPTTVAAILNYDTEARPSLVKCPTMVVAGIRSMTWLTLTELQNMSIWC